MPQEPARPPADDRPFDRLFKEFTDPPMSARPRAWWHWMDGNVDEAGIVKDLEWLAEAGAGGVQAFNGSMGTPAYVAEPVAFRSPAWQSAIRCAAGTADRLGLELSVATSAGWSATGGPWVRPAAGMKKLVWTATRINAGERPHLPAPPTASGPFQDIPFTAVRRASVDIPEHYGDVAVLAFPARGGHHPMRPAEVRASSEIHGERPLDTLDDGRYWPPAGLPASADGHPEAEPGTAWVLLDFGSPVAASSVRIGLPAQRGFGSPPAPSARLEASDDGTSFRTVVDLPPAASPVRSATFAEVTARYYRLVLTARTVPGFPVAPGVKPLRAPAAGSAPCFDLSALQLFAGPRVHRSEEKGGYAPVQDFYAIDGGESGRGEVQPEDVLDLTGLLQADGSVDWEPAQGSWTVIRWGYSLTGHLNAPAPADATGLEVDKLDGGLVAEYLETYLGFFGEALGTDATAQAGIAGLLSDSIESGPQNWTAAMRDEFRNRRGYDLLPWLPAVGGMVVGDARRSDAFLWDLRRTIAELLAENHYGTLARLAHGRGMSYYAEALEDHRPQLGDDLEMRSHADVPMGAMWCYEPDDGPQPTYVADLRGASSVANVYGKRAVGAESMSAFGKPFMFTPRNLKPVVDMEFALGVNLINIHTSPHQPDAAPKPGITLSPYLGQAFTRQETWSHAARPWLDYLSRCSHLLQQGKHSADILYFYGEEAPVTGVFGDAAPEVPDGYGFDFINVDGLLNHLTVTPDGYLRSSGGVEYRLLYLGGSSHRMTLAAVRRITELLDAGATVAGWRPDRSPSEGDGTHEWDAAVDALWNGQRQRLLDLAGTAPSRGLHAALARMGLGPDWALKAQVDSNLQVIHRSAEGGEVYFISNQRERPENFTATFRVSASRAELWDGVAAARIEVPVRTTAGNGSSIDLELAAFGSTFVVMERSRSLATAPQPLPAVALDQLLQGPWDVEFEDDGQLPPTTALPAVGPWSGPDADSRLSGAEYFSGTARYRHKFRWEPDSALSKVVVDLGDVHDLAEVRLNGHLAGTAWTRPFRVDVTDTIRPGDNTLEVAVANPWANRLMGDAASGLAALPGSAVFEADAAPLPAGLHGPVKLLAYPAM
ncbi:glycosyl hydrolase [Pseudarthrobacter enclensis]|uniref:glycosyl hydrolase n=1 Tax=Pseudarthrobacter enclensis TaxID=993070 RepID=UPI0036C3736A